MIWKTEPGYVWNAEDANRLRSYLADQDEEETAEYIKRTEEALTDLTRTVAGLAGIDRAVALGNMMSYHARRTMECWKYLDHFRHLEALVTQTEDAKLWDALTSVLDQMIERLLTQPGKHRSTDQFSNAESEVEAEMLLRYAEWLSRHLMMVSRGLLARWYAADGTRLPPEPKPEPPATPRTSATAARLAHGRGRR